MRRSILIFLILFITFLTSCSPKADNRFNDNDIKISLLNQEINDEYRTYLIEVKNTGILEIKYLNFYLYYPIILANGSKGSPFKIEGKTDISKPIKLKSGEKITYTIFAPIKEVFGNSTLLDFDNPSVELNGLVQQGKEEIPFGMSGGYLNMK
ncbi:hypothetical protein AB4114_23175 [Paenibacillus sp. 2RAB27]|uniref:Lipoprotein n=1 Tax=Paenibacillus plantarum TaxID=2654975 RepID=A0ABX1XGB2_9BACL|nr:hypothetical protein [Paenibacillus plantarum]NOU67503.1 hypothetical protein [Paenibacillus plantarum]